MLLLTNHYVLPDPGVAHPIGAPLLAALADAFR